MQAAQRKAQTAAQAVGRVALEVFGDSEALRARLLDWDFGFESPPITDLLADIGARLRSLTATLLGSLTYAIQLQKVATAKCAAAPKLAAAAAAATSTSTTTSPATPLYPSAGTSAG